VHMTSSQLSLGECNKFYWHSHMTESSDAL
jgi:hypothetical protein